MWFSTVVARRLIFIALLAVVAGCPFAIPVPWLGITRWVSGRVTENPDFLTGPVDSQSWFVVLGALCVGWASLLCFLKRRRFSNITADPAGHLVFFAVVAWFTITLVRAVFAPQFQSMGRDLLLQIAFLVVFVAGALHRSVTRDLVVFQLTLAVGVIPLAVIALMQNSGLDPLAYSAVVPGTLDIIRGKQLIASTFGHPNYMGSYMAPVVVMAAGLAASRVPLAWRVVGGGSAVVCILAMAAGGTRGPVLAVVAGLFSFFMLALCSGASRWTGRRVVNFMAVMLGTGSALVLTLVAFPGLRPSFDMSDRVFAGQEIASRVFYWIVGLEMLKTSPIFGIGAGQFDSQFWWTLSRMPEIEPGEPWHFIVQYVIRGVRPGFLHNDHLQVLVESGLIGAFAWTGIWAWVGAGCVRYSRRNAVGRSGALVNAAFSGAFAAVAVDAFFGFPFHLPCSGVLFWAALGLWCGWQRDKDDGCSMMLTGIFKEKRPEHDDCLLSAKYRNAL